MVILASTVLTLKCCLYWYLQDSTEESVGSIVVINTTHLYLLWQTFMFFPIYILVWFRSFLVHSWCLVAWYQCCLFYYERAYLDKYSSKIPFYNLDIAWLNWLDFCSCYKIYLTKSTIPLALAWLECFLLIWPYCSLLVYWSSERSEWLTLKYAKMDSYQFFSCDGSANFVASFWGSVDIVPRALHMWVQGQFRMCISDCNDHPENIWCWQVMLCWARQVETLERDTTDRHCNARHCFELSYFTVDRSPKSWWSSIYNEKL